MSISSISVVIAFAVIVLLFVIGAPIWSALMSGAVILLLFNLGIPYLMIPTTMFKSLDSFTLMATPFFLLAGNIMAYGGSSPYIFNFMNSWLGRVRAGIPIATILTAVVYAAITGSTTATLVGVSSIAMPNLRKAGYSDKYSAGLLACSATLGQLIPPSVLMIIYGSITSTDVGDLFLSGFVPGVICAGAIGVVAYIKSPKPEHLTAFDPEVYSWTSKKNNLIHGIPALIMPMIVLGGIYAGFVTPTEAGALSCVYGFVISIFVYKKMDFKVAGHTLSMSADALSMAFMLTSASLLFSIPITYMGVPQRIAEMVNNAGLTGTQLVLLITVLYLILGCFLDPLPIIFMVLPIVLPSLRAANINLIYFNIITIISMQIGQVTPPFGISLYLSAKLCNVEITDVIKSSLPYLGAMFLVLLLVIFVPGVSLVFE